MLGVPLRQFGQVVRELEQQLQAVAHLEREEVLARLGQRCGQGRGIHPLHCPTDGGTPARRAADAQRAGSSPGAFPVTIGTRTALPHSVHEPS
jgi:hypothetical protein